MSTLLTIIIEVVIVSVILYLINAYLPIDPKLKNILVAIIVIILILWLASLIIPFGSPKI